MLEPSPGLLNQPLINLGSRVEIAGALQEGGKLAIIFGIFSIGLGILQLLRPAGQSTLNQGYRREAGPLKTDLFNTSLSVVLIAFGLFLIFASLKGVR
ncbi:MAG: hypothetical protein K6T80_04790 [Firmicutes bacterium]|nr:hypothetical protein [Bacillota bacterium]